MKLKLALLMFLLLFACSKMKNSLAISNNKMDNIDTIVVSKTLPQEITGSLYRGKEYFVTIGNDTSYFSCIFLENTENGRTSIKFECNMYNKKYLSSTFDSAAIVERGFESKKPYYKTTYRQLIDEFKMILKKSAGDFDLSRLQYVHFGLLLSSGDLVVEVSNLYLKEFGSKITNYKRVEQILLDSQLGVDINKSLNSYSISIEQISIEKLHFVTRSELYKESKIETDSVQVPDKILNCAVYIKMKRF